MSIELALLMPWLAGFSAWEVSQVVTSLIWTVGLRLSIRQHPVWQEESTIPMGIPPIVGEKEAAMRLVWLWILAGMMIWPIHWTAATVSNKPIDLMTSDLLLLLMPLTYIFARNQTTANQLKWVVAPIRSHKMTLGLALVFVVYSTSLAGIGLGMSGEMLRLYSAFKLAKPVMYIFIGWLAWIRGLTRLSS